MNEFKLCHIKQVENQPEGVLRFRLTERIVDRDSEVIEPKGIMLDEYSKNPQFLWSHDIWGDHLPIGKTLVETAVQEMQYLDSDVLFDYKEDEFAKAVYRKYKGGFLNSGSIRFMPTEDGVSKEPVLPGQKGVTITKSKLLEFSAVIIPANPAANVIEKSMFPNNSGLYEVTNKFVKARNYKHDPQGWIDYLNKKNGDLDVNEQNKVIFDIAKNLPTQTVKQLFIKGSGSFDPSSEQLPPKNIEYDWAAKFCDCEVKDLFVIWTNFTGLWKGTFLSAYKHITKDWQNLDTRNIANSRNTGDSEMPPIYKNIQLNSKENDTFLVEGLQFNLTDDNIKMICKFKDGWYPELRIYIKRENEQKAIDLINNVWKWSRENHKLKGEAFTVSGDILKREEDSWNGIFLKEKNILSIKRMQRILEEKGVNAANRGQIYMGPPGTGKTLTGRKLKNILKDTTFLWLSSKDFWNYGDTGSMFRAFEIAKNLAPTILFMEDVDNWIGGYNLDVLKTEMDGIDKSNGVITILTSNYPELIPDSLIDRPGRFHDVLEFDLPEKSEREAMFKYWLPDIVDIDNIIEKTNGFSGAHIYELCEYSKIIKDEDQSTIDQAMIKALEKIYEQRELIDADQLAGSTYRPGRKNFLSQYDLSKWDHTAHAMNDLIDLDESKEIKEEIYNVLSKSYKSLEKEPPTLEIVIKKSIESSETSENGNFDVSKILDNLITNFKERTSDGN